MNKEKITREHRTLDDTDLRDINNTFKLIEKTLDSFKESNDRKFDSLKESNDSLKSELKSDITTIKWSIGFLIACISIAITISKLFS